VCFRCEVCLRTVNQYDRCRIPFSRSAQALFAGGAKCEAKCLRVGCRAGHQLIARPAWPLPMTTVVIHVTTSPGVVIRQATSTVKRRAIADSR
jgi:hypothetical protein